MVPEGINRSGEDLLMGILQLKARHK